MNRRDPSRSALGRERLVTTRLFVVASHWLAREPESPDEALERFVADQKQEFVEMFAVFSQRVEGHDYATPRQIELRDELYRLNLEQIVRAARGSGADVALLSLSQNFADWEPGASTHRHDLDPDAEDRWRTLWSEGLRAAAADDCPAALDLWSQALEIDDEYALLHYRVAECHRKLGQWDAARLHYRRASDLDRVPHGAPIYFNDLIRDVATREGALFVDTAEALTAASEHGLVGDDLFVEFAHPNLKAQQVMAGAVFDGLRKAGIPRPAAAWREVDWVDARAEVLMAEDPSLRVREHEAIRFTCVVARRPKCVAEQVRALRRLGAL